jgi:hypothetical protein
MLPARAGETALRVAETQGFGAGLRGGVRKGEGLASALMGEPGHGYGRLANGGGGGNCHDAGGGGILFLRARQVQGPHEAREEPSGCSQGTHFSTQARKGLFGTFCGLEDMSRELSVAHDGRERPWSKARRG